MEKLMEYWATMIPADVAKDVEEGNPVHFNGTFSPGFCNSEPFWANKHLIVGKSLLLKEGSIREAEDIENRMKSSEKNQETKIVEQGKTLFNIFSCITNSGCI